LKKQKVKKIKVRRIDDRSVIEIDSDTYDMLKEVYGQHKDIPYSKKLFIRTKKPEDEDEQP
jgi:hypothetical protein